MTARYFCNLCDGEVEHPEQQPEFTVQIRADNVDQTVGIRLIRTIDGVTNGGHVCNRCLSAALQAVIRDLNVVSP